MVKNIVLLILKDMIHYVKFIVILMFGIVMIVKKIFVLIVKVNMNVMI